MIWLKSLFKRVRGLISAERIHQEIDEEMRFHIDMRAEENVRRGMTVDEARADAERSFGRLTQLKEEGYDVRGGRWLEALWQDVGYGARMLRANPGFTLIAVVALALGIGANTAIFSVVNTVLLRPMPYGEAERIAVIQEYTQRGPAQVTPANFLDWREQNNVFEQMAAIGIRRANLTSAGLEPQRVQLSVTSTNFFQVMGVEPLMGRSFLPEEEKEGHEPVAILSHGLWRRRFAADPALVGKSIGVDGTDYRVIGVMPPGVDYPQDTELWVAPRNVVPEPDMDLGDLTQIRGFGMLSVVARMKPGVNIRQAQADMDTVTARLRQQYPETNSTRFDRVLLLRESLVGDVRPMLLILLGAVGCVLLIACANVANLLLARSAHRQKEIAIRTALGATRSRIIRQLLTESLLLAMVGGALGLLLASWGVGALTQFVPSDIPRLREIELDRWVLIFTLLLSCVTGIVFGLIPALQVSKPDLNETLKEGTRGATSGLRRARLRDILVVSEIALSLILLTSAGLLFRSFLILQSVKPGFDYDNVLTMKIAPTGESYREEKRQREFYNQVINRVRSIAGVVSVGAINTLPLSKGPTSGFVIEGQPPLTPDKMPGANRRFVSADYFRAMNIPVLKGRSFTEGDDESTQRIVIVNETLARRNFPGEDPLGKRIAFNWRDGQPIWREIVGVAGDVRSLELYSEPTPEMYAPYLQNTVPEMSFVVRTTGDPQGFVSAVRNEVYAVDKNQPVAGVMTMRQVVAESIKQRWFNMLLLGIFSTVALLLAAAGIYGVMSYSVAQRTHEIGIRLALGAKPSDVLGLVVGQGAKLTAAGVCVGLLGAFLATRVLSNFLFGIGPSDPLVYLGVALVLSCVALLASYIPARRAMKVDPIIALRYE